MCGGHQKISVKELFLQGAGDMHTPYGSLELTELID